ncbi:MAG: SRPBCC family protein [Gammaproteobacteria bacterium]
MQRLLAAMLTAAAGPAAAERGNVGAHGFTVTHSAATRAAPAAVYQSITENIDRWWNGDHSWSGDAANLYLRTGPGGCFCERLPDGGHVEHLRLIHDAPGRELRFDGALGPLQAMPVTGRMIWSIEAVDAGSRITFTYHVTGRPEGGLEGIAPAVDAVIGEQLGRLAALLDAR